MPQADLAAVPLRRELQAGEGVDRDRVGVDSMHVAEGDGGTASLQQRADPVAEAREVRPLDRAADREDERARPWGDHPEEGQKRPGKFIGAATDELGAGGASNRSNRLKRTRPKGHGTR